MRVTGETDVPRQDVEIDAERIAGALDMPTAHFLVEMRRGNVHGTVERGVGTDAGRSRLTIRHRGRRLTMILDESGTLIEQQLEASGSGKRDPALRPA
jgi:Arc/MetJ family transcription regulator